MTDTPEEAAIGLKCAIDLLAYAKKLPVKKGRAPLLGERKITISTCITPTDYNYARANKINIATVLANFFAKHRAEMEAAK
jgi:hypothetical protein